jgi:hypothetical protein
MKKSIGALAAAALLALSSACGGSGVDDTTPAAATASEAKPAAAAEASGELTRDNFVERLGAAQSAAGSTHMEMGSEVAGSALGMQGDVELADTIRESKTRITMDLGQMDIELRLVDGVAYIKLGQMSGGKYVKVDLTDPHDPLVKQYGSLADQIDPRAQLETFREALVEFENQGDGGRIDGVKTTRIKLVLDTAKLLKHQGAGQGRMGGGSMPKQLEYVLHVGSDDLMRKLTMNIGGTPTTLTWTNWGEPVEVTAPPASKITDSSALTGLGASSRRS